jgi:hypothetical protein
MCGSRNLPRDADGNLKLGAFAAAEAVRPSFAQENFGIAVVEALACARPRAHLEPVNIWREIVATVAVTRRMIISPHPSSARVAGAKRRAAQRAAMSASGAPLFRATL